MHTVFQLHRLQFSYIWESFTIIDNGPIQLWEHPLQPVSYAFCCHPLLGNLSPVAHFEANFFNFIVFILRFIINQEWQFDVFGLTYRPWRLYLAVCSVPGLISFLITTYLPESPKFILGQGNQEETYKILQKMNRLNNGKDSELESFEVCEEVESIENRKRILAIKDSRYPFLASVWHQTAPLFKTPYLSSTLLVCLIQFCIFYTSQGFNVFYAEILNKMTINGNDQHRAMMCDIINIKQMQPNITISGGNTTVNYKKKLSLKMNITTKLFNSSFRCALQN